PILVAVGIALLLLSSAPALIAAFDLPYQVFYIPSVLLGLVGGYSGITSAGLAFLVDVTTTETRTAAMSVYGVVTFVGSLVAIAIGGAAAGTPAVGDFAAYVPVFSATSAFVAASVLYIMLLGPETLPATATATAGPAADGATEEDPERHAGSEGGLAGTLATARLAIDSLRPLPPSIFLMLLVLTASVLLFQFNAQLANLRFGWGTRETSAYLFSENVVGALLSGVALPVAERWLRLHYSSVAAGRRARCAPKPAGATPSPALTESDPLLPRSPTSAALLADGGELVEFASDNDAQRRVTVRIHWAIMRFGLMGAAIGSALYATATRPWIWYA
ncbi:hypothetical protein HK405_002303, partial [Cladochytrium tenue]